MKKLPRKIKQWAAEAYEALENAWLLWSEDYPLLTESDRLMLMSYAVPIAATNRGVDKKEALQSASEIVLDNFRSDIDVIEVDEPIDYSMCFLIAYLDAQQAWGFINEVKSEHVMSYLVDHFGAQIDACEYIKD